MLETVPGLGPAKRKALLQHFGGLQGVLRAGANDLAQVSGIGPVLARVLPPEARFTRTFSVSMPAEARHQAPVQAGWGGGQ